MYDIYDDFCYHLIFWEVQGCGQWMVHLLRVQIMIQFPGEASGLSVNFWMIWFEYGIMQYGQV